MKKNNRIEEIIAFVLLVFLSITTTQAQFVEAEQCIGGNGNDLIKDIQQTPDSGWLIISITTSTDGDFTENQASSIGLVKLNKNFQVEWAHAYGDSVMTSYKLYQHDNNYYLSFVGFSNHPNDPTTVYYSVLEKIGSDGASLWSRSLVQTDQDALFYFLSNPNLHFLKNNTLINYVAQDTSVLIQNISLDGSLNWSHTFDYTENYANSYWGYISFGGLIKELDDNTILLSNTMEYFCMWICGGAIQKTHFINLDYNGNILRDSYSDTLLNRTWGFFYEDAENVYYHNNYPNAIYTLNKNTLALTTIDTLGGESPLAIYIYNNVIPNPIPSTKYTTVFIEWEFDIPSNNYRQKNIYLQQHNLITHELVYKTLFLDHPNNYFAFRSYNLQDNSHVLLYSNDTLYYLLKMDNAGNIIYNRLFSENLTTRSTFLYEFNSPNGTNLSPSYNTQDQLSRINGNKLYSYYILDYFDSTLQRYNTRQQIYIQDLETGNLEYEYASSLNDSMIYKLIIPNPQNDQELFTIADLNGQNSCRLGDYDIKISKVLKDANKILGRAFIDYNNNHTKDGSEPFYNLAFLESTKGTQTISTYMYGNSYTTNFVDTGAWVTKLTPSISYFTVTPASFSADHSDYPNNDTILFALYPNQTVKDLKLSLVNTFVTRLGQEATYDITNVNNGTHPTSGIVKVAIDPRLSFQNSIPAISAQNGDTLLWYFTNLPANGFSKISLTCVADIPPQLNGGDTIHSFAIITPIQNDTTPGDNIAVLDEIIRTSYDPNDKNTTSGKDITPSQIANDEYITYVVRFQNTGNDTAFRVVIEDTLDTKLDWSSLQPAGASHPFTMQVIDGNIIQFTFSNLKLPPANINEANSHGYIAYKIKVKKMHLLDIL